MIGEKITKKRKKLFLTVLVVIALCTYASRQISSLCTPLVETITASEGSLDTDFEEQGNSFKSRQSLLDLLLFTCNVLIIICLFFNIIII